MSEKEDEVDIIHDQEDHDSPLRVYYSQQLATTHRKKKEKIIDRLQDSVRVSLFTEYYERE